MSKLFRLTITFVGEKVIEFVDSNVDELNRAADELAKGRAILMTDSHTLPPLNRTIHSKNILYTDVCEIVPPKPKEETEPRHPRPGTKWRTQ